MTTGSAPELTADAIIANIESGAYSREIVDTIARGFLPLPQEELIAVLAYVGTLPDPELSALARTSLRDIPPRSMFAFASDERVPPAHLVRLTQLIEDGLTLEALIRNRAVTDEVVTELALRASPAVQEVIVINQARLLRTPAILDALLANPALSAEVRRRVVETREEFFEKRERLQRALEAEAADEEPEEIAEDLPLDPIADLLEKAAEMDQEETAAAPVVITEVERNDPKKFALWGRLQFMSVSEKVQLAFKGDKMARMILIRERNKLVSSSVMRNPRMTPQEAEAIAGMRNVDEEVLRLLSMRREWMGKYPVVLNLIKNPKTPPGVVLPLINRLTLRDLKSLRDDKGVSQIVRESAKKFYLARANKA